MSRSSSARRAGQLEEGRRQVELDGPARRRPTCKFTDGLALLVHRRAGVPPPGRTHTALSVSFRQVLVLLSVTRTARRPSGLAGYVQRWHRQPEVLPQIDQMDTRSQRHSGVSHSRFLVPELGVIECQVPSSSTKIVFKTITIGAVSEVKRTFLFVPLSTGLINWSFSLTGLTTFQDAVHTFPFFTRLRRRTSPSQSSRAGPPGQVQKVAARSSSHGQISSPCELD